MLETLSRGFENARDRLQGVQKLSEASLEEALRDVRMSLLEADVDLAVVKEFLAGVKAKSLGDKVATRVKDAQGRMHRITPGQQFVKACQEELEALMGPVDTSLARGKSGVVSVLLIGLQGVGKTTVAAKLASYLLNKQQRRPLLVAADIHRPAAVLQLQRLGERIGVPVHAGAEGATPAGICRAAAQRARTEGRDAIIYDTAGRLAIDDELMGELDEIQAATQPANRILVCDALMGRDAVNVAKAFSERLDIDGVILTKLDGDARGGAALAVKAVTGIPIKFLGTGEDVDRLEVFRPEGLASRILGMGDIVGLVEDFESVVDEKTAEEDAERLLTGKFGMDDLLTQLRTIQKMGPLKEVFSKMPMFGGMAEQADEKELVRVEAMIQSMTKQERKQPDVIDKSRASRIARGSGMQQSQVRDLVKRFGQMREMMAALGGGGAGGLLGKIPGMGNLAGAGAGAGGFDPSMLAGLQDGMGGAVGPGKAQAAKARSKGKKKRKQARKDRKKGRRK
ncbi:MAG: signal recognition particle protein [Deltaproteobacteria bacterium]|nr:signal recognition particle protein [Deltaproteobacteria bacterium]